MKKRFSAILLVLFSLVQTLAAQTYTLELRIQNQPFNSVAVGYMRGDRFILSDSVLTSNVIVSGRPLKIISWNFPSGAQPGIYRVVFGHTTYARVMDEPPQQLDFIFNGEDIQMETDFRAPADSLRIILSEENRTWFSFLEKEKEYRQILGELEMEVDFYQEKLARQGEGTGNGDTDNLRLKAAEVANSFNMLQMERESFVDKVSADASGMLASRIIKTFREPFRDGYLTEPERSVSWQKDYFRFIDFSDHALIYTPVLTDKIFDFLKSFNRREYSHAQREDAYIRAVEDVMLAVEKSTGKGGPVYEFVLDYLADGFEQLQMNKVLAWMADNYPEAVCSAGSRNTLSRKPEAQKMVVGSVVPDFTLNDLTGNRVTFSKDLKKINLVVFWASWCPHCNSLLKELSTFCSGKPDLEVFAVSLDRSADDWEKAVNETGMGKFRNLSDLQEWEGKVVDDYNVYATPAMFVVDANRRIIARPSSAADLSEVLSTF